MVAWGSKFVRSVWSPPPGEPTASQGGGRRWSRFPLGLAGPPVPQGRLGTLGTAGGFLLFCGGGLNEGHVIQAYRPAAKTPDTSLCMLATRCWRPSFTKPREGKRVERCP